MNHIKAMKQALYCVEAWERGCERDAYWRDIDECITALRAAIEQAEKQEPVACNCTNPWAHDQCTEAAGCKIKAKLTTPPIVATPLAAQRQWVGLSAEDLAEIPPSAYEGAIWADAKLKEKNT